MKHIETFNNFNEGIVNKMLSKFDSHFDTDKDERSVHNEIVKNIFDRVKETFNFNNISIPLQRVRFVSNYKYELEETDSDLGYIEINIRVRSGSILSPIINFELLIDNIEMNCSSRLKLKLFSFLEEKWAEKEKENKKTNLLKLKNKYNI